PRCRTFSLSMAFSVRLDSIMSAIDKALCSASWAAASTPLRPRMATMTKSQSRRAIKPAALARGPASEEKFMRSSINRQSTKLPDERSQADEESPEFRGPAGFKHQQIGPQHQG